MRKPFYVIPRLLVDTRFSGGKSQAATILNDSNFSLNKAVIFRKKQKPEVTMEFTASELEPFRIQDTAAQALILTGSGDENQELAYGTHVRYPQSFFWALFGLILPRCHKHLRSTPPPRCMVYICSS
jgi:hypothetical protein